MTLSLKQVTFAIHGFESHQCHWVVSLSKKINPSLVLAQPRKIRPYITEILLMGHKESNQTNKLLLQLLSKNLTASSDIFSNFWRLYTRLISKLTF